jgi:hypothetical protein
MCNLTALFSMYLLIVFQWKEKSSGDLRFVPPFPNTLSFFFCPKFVMRRWYETSISRIISIMHIVKLIKELYFLFYIYLKLFKKKINIRKKKDFVIQTKRDGVSYQIWPCCHVFVIYNFKLCKITWFFFIYSVSKIFILVLV